jgi:hypothetical protein
MFVRSIEERLGFGVWCLHLVFGVCIWRLAFAFGVWRYLFGVWCYLFRVKLFFKTEFSSVIKRN